MIRGLLSTELLNKKCVVVVVSGRRLHYLVHWQGYGSHEDTWEPADRIRVDSPQAVREFELAHRLPLSV